jgi:hypothetical protein
MLQPCDSINARCLSKQVARYSRTIGYFEVVITYLRLIGVHLVTVGPPSF